MWGGFLGLSYVENERWGGLVITLILATFGIACVSTRTIANAAFTSVRSIRTGSTNRIRTSHNTGNFNVGNLCSCSGISYYVVFI